jgi:hypothetical protein
MCFEYVIILPYLLLLRVCKYSDFFGILRYATEWKCCCFGYDDRVDIPSGTWT